MKSSHFLEISGLSMSFGGLEAVSNLNLQISEGEIFGLIGPNGAGKSTILNMIGGTLKPTSGKILFKGQDITGLPVHRKAMIGIGRLYQANILFNNFTLVENVLVALHMKIKFNLLKVLFQRRLLARQEKNLHERAANILETVGLIDIKDEVAVNLPHGQQRLLGLAIALAMEPALILLDEPVTGMAADEVEKMLDTTISLIKKFGMTCIIIEHNLRAVMSVCDRVAVVNFGCKIAEEETTKIFNHPKVIEAYLGGEDQCCWE